MVISLVVGFGSLMLGLLFVFFVMGATMDEKVQEKRRNKKSNFLAPNIEKAGYVCERVKDLRRDMQVDMPKLYEEKRDMTCEELASEDGQRFSKYYEYRLMLNLALESAEKYAIYATKALHGDKEVEHEKTV